MIVKFLLFHTFLLFVQISVGIQTQHKNRTRLFQIPNLTVYVGYSMEIFEPSTKLNSLNYTYTDITMDKNNGKPATINDSRTKRGVFDLYNIISCATGCNPLIYKGYGCFCGFLGAGRPVDGIDRCCKIHDWCYDTVNCPKLLVYLIPYYWQCFNNRPLCAIDHGDLGGPDSCARKLCECDRRFSECLKKFSCPKKRAVCSSAPFRLIQNILMIYP